MHFLLHLLSFITSIFQSIKINSAPLASALAQNVTMIIHKCIEILSYENKWAWNIKFDAFRINNLINYFLFSFSSAQFILQVSSLNAQMIYIYITNTYISSAMTILVGTTCSRSFCVWLKIWPFATPPYNCRTIVRPVTVLYHLHHKFSWITICIDLKNVCLSMFICIHTHDKNIVHLICL